MKVTLIEEFIVGKWYCGFESDMFGKGIDRDGMIGEYVGGGEFVDDDGSSFIFNDYDYFVAQ